MTLLKTAYDLWQARPAWQRAMVWFMAGMLMGFIFT